MIANGMPSAREEYVAALQEALSALVPATDRAALLGQTAEALDEAFGDLGRPETRDEIVEVFGTPEELASALARESAARLTGGGTVTSATDGSARVLGVPYEVRVPTSERFASRMWNPADPRLFVPRVFGMGWDLNFGALAVRLRLLRPDDVQDVPFSGVPRALTAALGWTSLAVLAGALGWTALVAEDLPPRVPYHFGISGPDRFASPLSSSAQLLGIPLVVVGIVVFATFVRKGTPLGRGLAAAVTPAAALMGLGLWANALSWAERGRYIVPTPVAVAFPLFVLFGLLLLLTRLGLKAEWREHGIGR